MPKRPKFSEDDLPVPGTVFASPMADGRFCSGRVLRRQTEGGYPSALIATSPWIGNGLPSLDLSELRETLVLNHHGWENVRWHFWVSERMPSNFAILGRIEVSDEEFSADSNSYANWNAVALQVLAQWRWDNDREALLREEALKTAADAESRRRAAETRAKYLKELTLDTLVGRTWFANWEQDSDEAPRHLEAARAVISTLIEELRTATKLTKVTAKRFLRRSVEAFNRLDSERQFIDTVERDDIYEAYEQIMSAARFPQLADCIDEWRDW